MAIEIHPQSVVHPEAELADGVVIGPFCTVAAGAKIGARTVLISHVAIGPHTPAVQPSSPIHPPCMLTPPTRRNAPGPSKLISVDSAAMQAHVAHGWGPGWAPVVGSIHGRLQNCNSFGRAMNLRAAGKCA